MSINKFKSSRIITLIIVVFITLPNLIQNCIPTSFNDQIASTIGGGTKQYSITNPAPSGCYRTMQIYTDVASISRSVYVIYQCPLGCAQCTSSTFCSSCLTANYKNGNLCSPCPFACQQCSNVGYCTSCVVGALMDGTNMCHFCYDYYGSDCSTCTATECTHCATMVLNNAAKSSLSACVDCSFISNCQACSNGPLCVTCFSAFTKSGDSLTCTITIPIQYCQIYGNDGACLNCFAAFHGGGTLCLINTALDFCQTYSTDGSCQSCFPAFTKSSGSTTCTITNPIQYCQIYQSDGTCSSCYAAFTRSGDRLTCTITTAVQYCQTYQNTGACLDCFSAFTRISNSVCTITSPIDYCQNYNNNGTCQNCYSSFSKSSNDLICTINTPISHCQTYQNDGTCLNCFSAFTKSANNLVCAITTPISYCQNYQDDGSCHNCYAPFLKSVSSLACSIIAPIQYCQIYHNDGTCFSCYAAFTKTRDNLPCKITTTIQYCVTYENDGTCKACKHQPTLNYGLEPGKLACYDCKTVSAQCYECTDQHKCGTCHSPYQVDSLGYCNNCIVGYRFVSGFCVSNNGCLHQQIINGVKICLSCFPLLNFQYNQLTHKCVCTLGFKQISQGLISKCVSICGDGILKDIEQCDDGNLNDNDGCDQFCKKQNNFECTLDSPSECTLNLQVDDFSQNYAEKLDGQNKCRFSFSVAPFHAALQNVRWQNYLTTNLTEDFIIMNSLVYKYEKETNEIILQFQYVKDIEDVAVKATLTFDNDPAKSRRRRLLQQIVNSQTTQNNEIGAQLKNNNVEGSFENKSIDIPQENRKTANQLYSRLLGPLPTASADQFSFVSTPSSRSLTLIISGVNQHLIYQSNASQLNTNYKVTSTLYIIVSAFILLQFVVGSYWHKMIGLETIQVFQLIYFVRMILDEDLKPHFKSMNVLNYAAFGGYNNWRLFYNISQNVVKLITRFTGNAKFASIELLNYFSLNINISLAPLGLFLIYYIYYLGKKYRVRIKYISSKSQDQLSNYTVAKRKSQWIYNHLIFPFLMIFSLISFFISILYFNSLQLPSSLIAKYQSQIILLERINIPIHLMILYLTVGIYCNQAFISFEMFWKSKLSVQQKQKMPQSLIEKLQHDQNNPANQQNYKPGYVLIYLNYYLLLQILIAINLFMPNLKALTIYAMLSITLIYVIILCIWNPYYQSINIHNTVIKYNHFIILLFVFMISLLSTFIKVHSYLYLTIINYLLVALLVVLSVLGYVRIYFQYKFRSKLEENSTLLTKQIKQNNQNQEYQKKDINNIVEKLSRRQLLLHGNPFLFHENLIENAKQNTKYLKKGIKQPNKLKRKSQSNAMIQLDKKRKVCKQTLQTPCQQQKLLETLVKQDGKTQLKLIKQRIKSKANYYQN